MTDYFSFFQERTPSNIWNRGINYMGNIIRVMYADNRTKVEAVVQGNDEYEVTIDKNQYGFDAECSCPYNEYGEGDYCKHISALVQYLRADHFSFAQMSSHRDYGQQYDNIFRQIIDHEQQIENVSENSKTIQKQEKINRLKQLFGFQPKKDFSNLYPDYTNPKIQHYLGYNVTIERGQPRLELLKINKSNPNKYQVLDYFSAVSRARNDQSPYISHWDKNFIVRELNTQGDYYSTKINGKKFQKIIYNLDLSGKLFVDHKPAKIIHNAEIRVEIVEKRGIFRAVCFVVYGGISEKISEYKLFGDSDFIVLIGLEKGMLVTLKTEYSFDDLELLMSKIELDSSDVEDIAKAVDTKTIAIPKEFIVDEIESERVNPRIFLSEHNNLLRVVLKFRYDELLFDIDSHDPELKHIFSQSNGHKKLLVRNNKLESIYKNLLTETLQNTIRSDLSYYENMDLSRDEAILFVLEALPLLSQFEVFGQENLKTHNYVRPVSKLSLTAGTDWFDMAGNMDFGGQEIHIGEIAKLFRKNNRFVKLSDGRSGVLPQDWLDKHRELFDLGEITGDGVRVSKWHASLLQEFSKIEAQDVSHQWQSQITNLVSFEKIKKLPKSTVTATLKPYQQHGYEWLWFLYSNTMGGILADDMGLGKTLQIITILNKIYSNKKTTTTKPTLLVIPKSLIVNWQIELQKFAPKLNFIVYHGQSRERSTLQNYTSGIIITTYATLTRDIEHIRDIQFELVILDESQYIKNPTSLAYKAIRLLKSRCRFALTGTPVENNLEDLWSQVSFINPGLLGSREYFRTHFAVPIQKDNNEIQAEKLRTILFPFMLRRLKQDVATELGDKVETTLVAEMSPPQRKMYDRVRMAFKKEVSKMLEENQSQTKFKALQGLTKLRQICCDPRLVDSESNIASGKLEMLLQTIEPIVAENHKVLIFSQFTSMLGHVKDALDARGVRYSYLDGKTNNRQAVVDDFQSDDTIPVFLISLKAGGVGLNLTSADYVCIYDPWWNPAVESQAVDRAHRIGQNKTVFVYRFITKNSVEEKILELQQTKQALVKNIIVPDESFMKKLSGKDITKLFE